MDTPWRVELFGEMRVYRPDRTITRFPTQRTAVLLAFLAMNAHREHSREFLAELLWPEQDWLLTRDRLNQAVSSLRRQLEPPGTTPGSVLATNRLTARINPEAVEVDTRQFEAGITAAQQLAEPDAQAERLWEAISLYKEGLLPRFHDEWITMERQRLSDLCFFALTQLASLSEERGNRARAIECMQRAIVLNPFEEESHATLIRLYRDGGNKAMAERVYRELERLLEKELGEKPAPETRELLSKPSIAPAARVANLFPGSTELAEVLPPSPRPGEGERNLQSFPSRRRIPAQLTRFFGRESQIQDIAHAVLAKKSRLVSLVGPGGAGKSRLAIKVGEELLGALENAVWFVSLANLHDPAFIPETILLAMGLTSGEGLSGIERVSQVLGTREASLLILDNFEQLSEGGPEVIHRLLAETPTAAILVTSRQKLSIEGEKEINVTPLPTPDAGLTAMQVLQLPSVQLFVDRAQNVRADFQVTDRNADAVAELVRKMEGIPLALELAASWAKTLSPKQMLAELDRPFDLLVSRRKDVPLRHRTLRTTIDDSFRQLPEAAKRCFALLSVFPASWSLEAVRNVCALPNARDLLVMG